MLARLGTAILLMAAATAFSAEARSPQLNILFIMADDLGIRDLGSYGSDYHQTPCLDQLAMQGTRFTRAYSASPVCSPTRAAILTGRYPHRVHLTDALPWDRLFENPKWIPPRHSKELPKEMNNFAKVLREAGYRTGLFGKWHLGNEYDFFGKGGHADYGFDEAFAVNPAELKRDKGVGQLTDRTIRFLEENRDGPFMLCLMHHTPHVPLASLPEEEALYATVPIGHFQGNPAYAGMITHLDRSMGRLLEKLTELGLDDRTIVIFTSDNGGLQNVTSNLPFRGGKGDLYEGGVRVPLIVRWPGRAEPDSLCDTPVISMDFFPTFLEIAGLPLLPDAHVDGESLVTLISGNPARQRTLFWHFPHRANPASSVLHGDFKLVHSIETGLSEVFDLSVDPFETNDLSSGCDGDIRCLADRLGQHLFDAKAQHMRLNPQWDPDKPRGKLKNYGIFYPAQGGTYQQTGESPPCWFEEGMTSGDSTNE